jgi:hypothetical protein
MNDYYIVGVAYGQKKKTIEYGICRDIETAKLLAEELKTKTTKPVLILQEVEVNDE